MNDQQIYECIALNGPMSAAGIAQALNTELDDTIEHLAALRGIGDLTLTDGVYAFSRGFLKSEDCRRAKAKAEATQQGRAGAGGSMEDRAINFLIARGGRCMGWELHAALGLAPAEMPSSVLADALAAGRLFKEGKEWFVDRRSETRTTASIQAMFEDDLKLGPPRAEPLVLCWPRGVELGDEELAPCTDLSWMRGTDYNADSED